MKWDNKKYCECGSLTTIKKASGAICDRCNKIETEMMHQQGREDKKISCGNGSFGDTYTVALPKQKAGGKRL